MLHISSTGLVTIAGGKWTTYRKMAEDTVDQAALLAFLEPRISVTQELHIHGYHRNSAHFGVLSMYGSDAPALQDLMEAEPQYSQVLHPRLDIRAGQVIWAVRYEMARTVEDFLARRTRALLLDARASLAIAPQVAALMAAELGYDTVWEATQIDEYNKIAASYSVN